MYGPGRGLQGAQIGWEGVCAVYGGGGRGGPWVRGLAGVRWGRERGLWGVLMGSRAWHVAPCVGAGLFLRVPSCSPRVSRQWWVLCACCCTLVSVPHEVMDSQQRFYRSPGWPGGLTGGCWWGWVCAALTPPLPMPVFPDTKPYEAAEPFGATPGKMGAVGPGAPWEKGKSSEVSVMLTVSAAAAKVSAGTGGRQDPWVVAPRALDPSCPPFPQNLNGVMVAMAELLSVKIPSSYEVLFPDGAMRAAVVEAKKVETDMAGERLPRVPGPGSPVSPEQASRDGLCLSRRGARWQGEGGAGREGAGQQL